MRFQALDELKALAGGFDAYFDGLANDPETLVALLLKGIDNGVDES